MRHWVVRATNDDRPRRLAWLLLWSACACATGPRAVPGSENAELALQILSGEGAAPLSLLLDSEWYFSKSEAPARGRLEDGPQSAAVDLVKVGHASKMLCRYSKLRVRFPGARPHELFLITHCNDTEAAQGFLPSEAQLFGQYLANRVRAALEIPGLSVRLAALRYVDPEREATPPHAALFVEGAVDQAIALAGSASALQAPEDRGPTTSVRALDPEAVALFHLFQILINNRDWKLFELRPLLRWFLPQETPGALHNAFVVRRNDGLGFVMPVDLDASSFAVVPAVGAAVMGVDDARLVATLASPHLAPEGSTLERLMALGLIHFERSHRKPARDAAIAHLRARREALTRAVTTSSLPPETTARAEEHLLAFDRALLAVSSVHIVRADAPLFRAASGEDAHCTLSARAGVIVQGEGLRVPVQLAETRALEPGMGRPLCNALEGWMNAADLEP